MITRLTRGEITRMTKRLIWLDELKGFAISLVVLMHLLGGLYQKGVVGIFGQECGEFINTFIMPLFIALSGYAWSLSTKKNNKNWMSNKILNFILMYFIWELVYCIYLLLGKSFRSDSFDIGQAVLIPIKALGPYWYLYILSALYLTKFIMNKVLIFHLKWGGVSENLSKKRVGIYAVAVILLLIYFMFDLPYEYTILRFANFWLFFELGSDLDIILIKINNNFNKYIRGLIIFLMLLIGCIAAMLLGFHLIDLKYIEPMVLVIGAIGMIISVTYIFKNLSINSRILSYLGEKSLQIFLTHCFVVAIVKTLFSKMIGIYNCNIVALIMVGLSISIIIPVVFARVVSKFSILNSLLFNPVVLLKGEKYHECS